MTFWTSNYCFWLKYESSIHNLAFSGAFDCSIMSLSIWLWKNTFSSFFLMHLKFIHLKCSVCSFLFLENKPKLLMTPPALLRYLSNQMLHWMTMSLSYYLTFWKQILTNFLRNSEKICSFYLTILTFFSCTHEFISQLWFFFFLQHSFARKKFKLWGKSRNYPFLIPWQK